MHISQLKQSKFLTRADAGNGILVTIREVFQENVAKDGAPEELRWCISFNECEKPMVLNSTNGQIIAQVTASEDTDNWPGKQIVLYDDPNVSFGGKLVGGIRCRAPRNQPKAAPGPVSAPTRANPEPAHGILGKPANRPEPASTEPEPDDPPF